ncbi:MAG TPA: WYL domain-containing protein, partial [Acidimicrobiales bacterium]|nr:WYL domain-containing protein [Acidimicrobiales bacterium]
MSGRTEAGQRLRRLLAVLTWLARVQRAPVAELAERFSMSPDELVADLELAACCGLPPYTPDQLMEIVVDDQEVVANLGDELARPRRLTAAEGFALAAAARAILDSAGLDGAKAGTDGAGGALASALSKLDTALAGGSEGRAPAGNGDGTEASSPAGGLQVDLGEAAHLAQVRAAVEGGRQLAVRYYSLSSDEESERVIDPLALVALEGHWYLDAYCHRASGIRRF